MAGCAFSRLGPKALVIEEADMSNRTRTSSTLTLDTDLGYWKQRGGGRRSRRFHSLLGAVMLWGLAGPLGHSAEAAPSAPKTQARPKSSEESRRFALLVDRFVLELGQHYPSETTDLGLHDHDQDLEDLTPAGVQKTLAWLLDWDRRLAAIDPTQLTVDEQLDLKLLRHSLVTRRFSLHDLPDHKRRPNAYSGLASRSVNAILKRSYAPLAEKLPSVVSRLRKASALIRQAPQQLDDVSVASVDVTLRTLPATIEFFRRDVPLAFASVSDPAKQKQLKDACEETALALTGLQDHLRKEGRAKAKPDFALGEDLFRRALFAEEMIDTPIDQLLTQAEAELSRLRAEFQKTAARIDAKKSAQETQTAVAQDHPQPSELLAYTASRLAAQRKFLFDHNIVTVPSEVLPQVQETPPFMRATTLASMDTPGPYEKASEAYYYITLPDPTWKPAETEDFLRGAHNRPLIDVVTIHEAFPGHYVQYLWMSRLSKVRQVAQVESNSEGWAHYAEEMMMEEGYAKSDPKVRLMQLQDALLRAARFVAGIRMHCRGMTQAQAEAFFVREGLQMKTVAELEARRGTQDPLYIVYTYGKLQILKLRADYQAQQGSAYSLRQFHDTLLRYGRAPLSLIRAAMLGPSPKL